MIFFEKPNLLLIHLFYNKIASKPLLAIISNHIIKWQMHNRKIKINYDCENSFKYFNKNKYILLIIIIRVHKIFFNF